MDCEIIKVCGMREAENIREVERLRADGQSLGIDWMGLIFAPKSSRYVSEPPSYLPTACKRVGVFVNAEIDDVVQHVRDYNLDLIQLHGTESPDYIRQLRKVLSGCSIIKVFNIATADDLAATAGYEGLADYFLFDTKGKLIGGNGTKFDWSVLTEYRGNTPFLLSGGIGPDDAERLKAFFAAQRKSAADHPKCIGIDLNSRFEVSPALKDVNKLQTFIKQITI